MQIRSEKKKILGTMMKQSKNQSNKKEIKYVSCKFHLLMWCTQAKNKATCRYHSLQCFKKAIFIQTFEKLVILRYTQRLS